MGLEEVVGPSWDGWTVWLKILEIWELITGRQQHKIGKDGGDFYRKPRHDKGCSATDDDDDEYIYSPTLVNAVGGLDRGIQIWADTSCLSCRYCAATCPGDGQTSLTCNAHYAKGITKTS
jgi:hypothetical protein